ncbi:hypothetical protein PG994_014512 [Apiospora phragmitis]|uniref:Uncharacterized protein n=1 Tax=Apiospora phragmitis TaxID=2905665 RepID=A0ABR1T4H3_9PEZI
MGHAAPCRLRQAHRGAAHGIHPALGLGSRGGRQPVQLHSNTKSNNDGPPLLVDPWRSRWAPPPTNPYICSTCFDRRHRPHPHPAPSKFSLPCLCARRANLQVLLMCRRWYAEAGRVFYVRNTFAFADPRECVEFLTTLAPRWRRLISQVSLLALAARDYVPESAARELEMVQVPTEGDAGLARALALLRELPALT